MKKKCGNSEKNLQHAYINEAQLTIQLGNYIWTILNMFHFILQLLLADEKKLDFFLKNVNHHGVL